MASVRAATPGDYGLFTQFYASLDAPARTPNRDWWNRSYSDALFLEDGGSAVAYAFAYRLGRELGHVAHVVVAESLRGRGLGRAVMDAAADRLRDCGCVRWSLYVDATNEPAIALYRRCDMDVTGSIDEIEIDCTRVRALPSDSSLFVQPLGVEDDASIERAFGLPEGRIARVRRLPNRSFFVANRGDLAVGTIAFDENTRSTPFLCAASSAAARALIGAAASSGDARLWINNDKPLSDALIACGGRVVRHLHQMDGALAGGPERK